MKEFFRVMGRFVSPYKKYVGWAVVLNLLSAIFNVFSFSLLIPILNILFKTGAQDQTYQYILNILFKTGAQDQTYQYMEWEWTVDSLKETAVNNFYYYVNQLIESFGPATTLLFLGLFLALMTFLKTGCYFGSSAAMIPLRTGIVRDIRRLVYAKVMYLPLGFFSEERKGDIIARMSGDVSEIETSITSSLDMLLKNPILIISYFATLLIISWQLTLFTILVLPTMGWLMGKIGRKLKRQSLEAQGKWSETMSQLEETLGGLRVITILVLPTMGWLMGKIGRKLKRQSLEAQGKWSETMSQLEETLGGLRVIKAFTAEEKMINRFNKCSDEYRDATSRVSTRQALAHPMSEFLGTVLIVFVLWFGGSLILDNNSSIDASTFIYYMVILYSIINPLKDFSKASYMIPRGLASMERVDKILKAPNNIKEKENPQPLSELKESIDFNHITFSYNGQYQVLNDISLRIRKGETIALVGQSGSGKSTLVDLLPREAH